MWTAAIAGADPNRAVQLRGCLQQTGLIDSVQEWDLKSQQERPWEQRATAADVVVLILDGNPGLELPFAAELRRAHPNVRIIAYSPEKQPDSELLTNSMRSGVQEFLPSLLSVAVVKQALTRFAYGAEAGEERLPQKLILVMGSKGGGCEHGRGQSFGSTDPAHPAERGSARLCPSHRARRLDAGYATQVLPARRDREPGTPGHTFLQQPSHPAQNGAASSGRRYSVGRMGADCAAGPARCHQRGARSIRLRRDGLRQHLFPRMALNRRSAARPDHPGCGGLHQSGALDTGAACSEPHLHRH